MMKQKTLLMAFLAFITAGLAFAAEPGTAPQLQQGAIVNAASFAVDGAPNSPIARGSLFTVFGVDVGPRDAVRANEFPLPTELGGVSIKITAGGQDYDAIILFANSTQVSAILPSAVPAGQASLVLTYGGQASNAITFSVADRQGGFFSRSQTGNGVAVVQNFISPDNQPTNTLNQAAQPGQVLILWGTGLGASINGDDRNPPAPGNVIPLDQIKVYVGGKEAAVQYAGRSGCCSGVDQVNFVVPDGVEGCFVPVVVTLNGAPSNFVTIAVNGQDTFCEDSFGLTKDLVRTLSSQQTIRSGVITLSRTRTETSTPQGNFSFNSDVGVASFKEFTVAGLLDGGGILGDGAFTTGSCLVTSYRADITGGDVPEPPEFEDLFRVKNLDAGPAININGPRGARQLPQTQDDPGSYFASLTNIMNPLDSYLDPGDYTFNNGAGGADVKAFSFTENVPAFLNWTNKGAINAVNRNQELTVTWNPITTPNGVTAIFGTSFSISKKVASALFCYADASTGTFTIPAYILQAMVASESISAQVPGGSLSVGGFNDLSMFSADGIDFGAFTVSSIESKSLNYQ